MADILYLITSTPFWDLNPSSQMVSFKTNDKSNVFRLKNMSLFKAMVSVFGL